MSACENLPQELIAAIVDNIRNDRRSLKAFSLVCRAWTDPAREYLFAALNMTNRNNCPEKMKAANVASTYTRFLRHLALTAFENDSDFWPEIILFLADFRTPRLRSLDICSLPWHSLSADQQMAFLRRFESIISLGLSLDKQDTPNDVPTIICSLPHLRKFILKPSFHKCTLSWPFPDPLSPELRLPERLSTLYISYSHEKNPLVLERLRLIPEQGSITTLCLSMNWPFQQDIDDVNVFLRALGPSLEVFGCNPRKNLAVNLNYNTRLRCIHAHVAGFEFFREDVSSVISTLSGIGSRQVERIAFHLGSPFHQDGGSHSAEWIEIDAILDSPQFAALKDVHICPIQYPIGVADLLASFTTLLPTCHARGIISVTDSPFWDPVFW